MDGFLSGRFHRLYYDSYRFLHIMNKVIAINSITKKKVTYTAPSHWNELNEKQLIAWAAICLKKLSIDNAIRLALIAMYGIPPMEFFLIPESQKVELAPTIKFLFEKNNLVKWVIPQIGCGFRNYYGPEDRLGNITIAEFRRTELYYQAYIKTGQDEYLDLLIATLYRAKRKGLIDKDIREDITEYGIRNRAKRLKSLSRKFRQATLLNYEGCRGFIHANYLSKLPTSKSDTPSKELFDFNGIIRTIAGGKFGTFEETNSAMLYDFLEHLLETVKEVERLNAKS